MPRAVNLAKLIPPAANKPEMENILHELANLQIGERKVLGDRINIANAVVRPKSEDKKEVRKEEIPEKASPPSPPPPPAPPPKKEVIEISSGSEEIAVPRLTPKARQLIKLTKAVTTATDNARLAETV